MVLQKRTSVPSFVQTPLHEIAERLFPSLLNGPSSSCSCNLGKYGKSIGLHQFDIQQYFCDTLRPASLRRLQTVLLDTPSIFAMLTALNPNSISDSRMEALITNRGLPGARVLSAVLIYCRSMMNFLLSSFAQILKKDKRSAKLGKYTTR